MKWLLRFGLWSMLWVGVLVLLAVMLGLNTATHCGRYRDQAAIKDIQLGIKNYQVEYNAYPTSTPGVAKQDFATDSTGELLQCLLGQKVWGNTRGIAFIEPSTAKEGKGGLVLEAGKERLVDRWGHPHHVLMDTNYDSKLANPDAVNTDASIRADAPAELLAGVVIFSLGADRLANTADDITSWRGGPATKESFLFSTFGALFDNPWVLALVLIGLSIAGLMVIRQ